MAESPFCLRAYGRFAGEQEDTRGERGVDTDSGGESEFEIEREIEGEKKSGKKEGTTTTTTTITKTKTKEEEEKIQPKEEEEMMSPDDYAEMVLSLDDEPHQQFIFPKVTEENISKQYLAYAEVIIEAEDIDRTTDTYTPFPVTSLMRALQVLIKKGKDNTNKELRAVRKEIEAFVETARETLQTPQFMESLSQDLQNTPPNGSVIERITTLHEELDKLSNVVNTHAGSREGEEKAKVDFHKVHTYMRATADVVDAQENEVFEEDVMQSAFVRHFLPNMSTLLSLSPDGLEWIEHILFSLVFVYRDVARVRRLFSLDAALDVRDEILRRVNIMYWEDHDRITMKKHLFSYLLDETFTATEADLAEFETHIPIELENESVFAHIQIAAVKQLWTRLLPILDALQSRIDTKQWADDSDSTYRIAFLYAQKLRKEEPEKMSAYILHTITRFLTPWFLALLATESPRQAGETGAEAELVKLEPGEGREIETTNQLLMWMQIVDHAIPALIMHGIPLGGVLSSEYHFTTFWYEEMRKTIHLDNEENSILPSNKYKAFLKELRTLRKQQREEAKVMWFYVSGAALAVGSIALVVARKKIVSLWRENFPAFASETGVSVMTKTLKSMFSSIWRLQRPKDRRAQLAGRQLVAGIAVPLILESLQAAYFGRGLLSQVPPDWMPNLITLGGSYNIIWVHWRAFSQLAAWPTSFFLEEPNVALGLVLLAAVITAYTHFAVPPRNLSERTAGNYRTLKSVMLKDFTHRLPRFIIQTTPAWAWFILKEVFSLSGGIQSLAGAMLAYAGSWTLFTSKRANAWLTLLVRSGLGVALFKIPFGAFIAWIQTNSPDALTEALIFMMKTVWDAVIPGTLGGASMRLLLFVLVWFNLYMPFIDRTANSRVRLYRALHFLMVFIGASILSGPLDLETIAEETLQTRILWSMAYAVTMGGWAVALVPIQRGNAIFPSADEIRRGVRLRTEGNEHLIIARALRKERERLKRRRRFLL